MKSRVFIQKMTYFVQIIWILVLKVKMQENVIIWYLVLFKQFWFSQIWWRSLVDGQKSNHVSRLYQFCWNKYHIEVKATMKLNQKLLHICNIGIILQEVIWQHFHGQGNCQNTQEIQFPQWLLRANQGSAKKWYRTG